MRGGIALLVGVTIGTPTYAQGVFGVGELSLEMGESVDVPQSQILTIDQDRLFQESEYGQRIQAEIRKASQELAVENRQIEAELAAEELDLTEQRKALPPADFRVLADQFDEKVTDIRRRQDSKTVALQRQGELARNAFASNALPILSTIVEEAGAVAIIDRDSVFLTVSKIDITDIAIERMNAELGDGMGSEATRGTAQEERPNQAPALENGQ